jgi:LysR family transcriptional regulator, glycine cleavage system transcriptional activator
VSVNSGSNPEFNFDFRSDLSRARTIQALLDLLGLMIVRKLPNMNALRAFECAARLESFSRAADELCVTQGAISWHIKKLEAYLGVPLFRRQTRAVELTDYGREYLPATRDAFDQIEQATVRMERLSHSRVLVADVLPTFAMRWLVPRLALFNKENPDIEIHLLTSIKPVDFQRDDVDLAIRVGNPPDATARQGPRINLEMASDWSGIHSDKLMPDILIPVCSPILFSTIDAPKTSNDLLRFPLLHTATRPDAWPDWFRAVTGVEPTSKLKGHSFGHFFMTIQAAAEGRGIALVPTTLVEEDLSERRLIVALDTPVQSMGDYYFLCRKSQVDLPAIRQFREWLFENVKLKGF